MNNEWKDGLPPVGAECLALKVYTVTVKGYDGDVAICKHRSIDGISDYKGYTAKQLSPIKTEADKYRAKQLKCFQEILDGYHGMTAEILYDEGFRILAPDERIVKPLTAKQYAVLCGYRDLDWDQIDAVLRELGVIG